MPDLDLLAAELKLDLPPEMELFSRALKQLDLTYPFITYGKEDVAIAMQEGLPAQTMERLAQLRLLGQACQVYAKRDWDEFCRNVFPKLDEVHQQSMLDAMQLWHANAPDKQWRRRNFLVGPQQTETIRQIIEQYRSQTSADERTLLTLRLFEAIDQLKPEEIQRPPSYEAFVSQLYQQMSLSLLRGKVDGYCTRPNMSFHIPPEATLLDYALIERMLFDEFRLKFDHITEVRGGEIDMDNVRFTETEVLYAANILDDDAVTEVEIADDEEWGEVETLELQDVTRPAPDSDVIQQKIDAIVARPLIQKRREYAAQHKQVSDLEMELRFGRYGFSYEERKALKEHLHPRMLQGLKIADIAEAMHLLRDSLPANKDGSVRDYEGWEIPSAIAVVNVFGKNWRKWLEQQTEYGLSMHDAVYWLPSDISASEAMGEDPVPSLAEFLQRYRWSQDGQIETTLSNGKKRKGQPRHTGELAVIARNWQGLSEADRQKPYSEVLSIARSRHYIGERHNAFAVEAAYHGVKPDKYRDAESIYLSGQHIPEPFDSSQRFEAGNLTARFLPRSDARAGFFGEYVNCCQRIHGHAHDAAVATVADPHSQLFAVEDQTGKIVGGAMVWRRLEPAPGHPGKYVWSACFDSVELKGISTQIGVTEESQRSPNIIKRQKENTQIHQALARYLTEACGYGRVTMATAYNTLDKDYLATLPVLSTIDNLRVPSAYEGRYSDAGKQYRVASNPSPKLIDGKDVKADVWVRSADLIVNGKDETAMDRIAKQVYPEGFQEADEADGKLETRFVLMRDHPDPGQKSGLVGYAVIDDANQYIADLAVDPACRGDALKLLNHVLSYCEQAGGTWKAHARESSTLKLLQVAEKKGRIKLTQDDDANELAEGDVAHSVSFEVIAKPKTKDIPASGITLESAPKAQVAAR